MVGCVLTRKQSVYLSGWETVADQAVAPGTSSVAFCRGVETAHESVSLTLKKCIYVFN